MPPDAAPGAPAVAERDRYPWVAMGVVLIGTFMVILDTSIVNVALPQISIELESREGVEWVVTAYLLALALATPASGWLADTFGRKNVFITALAVFTTGSLLAALAPNLGFLVGFRALQGLGGGALMPVGLATIYELFPPERRGTALGVWGVAAMSAPALGPVIGGSIATSVSWRWLFLVNVPVGVVGLVAASRWLRETGYRLVRRFDALGLALVGVGLALVLLGSTGAPDRGWGAPSTLALLLVGTFLCVAFVLHVLRTDHPLIDVRMFRVSTFSLSITIISLVTIMQYGRLVFIPLQLQTLRGFTPLRVGVLLVPSAIGAAITMPLGGRLADRIGARIPVLIGTAILSVAAWMLAHLRIDTHELTIAAIIGFQGFGIGLAMMPNTVAGLNSLPHTFVAQSAAVRNMIRQLAGAVGVAVLATVVASRLPPGAPGDLGADGIRDAQAAYNTVFLIGCVATVLGFLLALFLPGGERTRAMHAARARELEEIETFDEVY